MKMLPSYSAVMQKYKPYASMILIQFIYAGMALFSKAAISKGMDPFVFVVYRQAFATLALSPPAFFFESKATSLSFNLICKIFLVSLCGITLSLNLYYVAINYTSATLAAATTNTIPAITFLMAAILRMESISIKHVCGLAKVMGSIACLSGAMVFAFVKGPPLSFMQWYSSADQKQAHGSYPLGCPRGELIKGALIMISANTTWSFWLILQGLIVKQYPSKIRLTALQCFFSCIQSAVWAIALQRNPSSWKLGWDVHLLSVAYCGIIVTGISYWLQVCAIEEKGPVFTAMFTPLALIITAICSAILWKETLYWGSVGGAFLLVVGLYSVLWGKTKEAKKTEAKENGQEVKEETIECITQH